MITFQNVIYLVLILGLTISIYTDIRVRKIYNVISLSMIILGIILTVIVKGNLIYGLIFSFFGVLLGLIILLIPYLMGGIGAGDVKLLMGVGALMGYEFTLNAAIYMAIIGGILAILNLMKRKKLISTINQLSFFIVNSNVGEKDTVPYGVAIALGTFIQLAKLFI